MATIQAWIDRRVGSAGEARSLIVSHLLLVLPPPPAGRAEASPAPAPLGLSGEALDHLAEAHDFAALARHFPTRGDTHRLVKVAWYGSALADITGTPAAPEREQVLRDAALFNVAVALFDTIVEDQPGRLGPAQAALHPPALHWRLLHPCDQRAALTTPDAALCGLVGLFDTVLSSTGRRFSGDPTTLAYFTSLLTTMYDSEVGHTLDRTPAKTLPLVFIGLLGVGVRRPAVVTLIERIAQLLSLLDDWLDLGSDIRRMHANGFVLPYAGRGRYVLPYVHRALHRVCGGRSSHADIAWTLSRAVQGVLRAAAEAGPVAQAKTSALLWRVVRAT